MLGDSHRLSLLRSLLNIARQGCASRAAGFPRRPGLDGVAATACEGVGGPKLAALTTSLSGETAQAGQKETITFHRKAATAATGCRDCGCSRDRQGTAGRVRRSSYVFSRSQRHSTEAIREGVGA
jgi:hypothetical protein